MAPVGTVRIVWSGGEDDFCMAQVGSILALQEACNAGIAAIFARLLDGSWWLNDIRETIRLGLIGGGKTPDQAMKLVKLHVDANPLAMSVMIARAILQAVMIGVPDDPVGKTQAAEAETGQVSSTTTAASAAAQPMESVPA